VSSPGSGRLEHEEAVVSGLEHVHLAMGADVVDAVRVSARKIMPSWRRRARQ
jgi:hypothetical protein